MESPTEPPADDRRDLTALERALRLEFTNPGLLRDALTHRSYAFEHGGVTNNERLEFLGDSVLGLVVTDLIFSEFPHLPEGEMAKLRAATVNMGVLADVARDLGLGQHLHLGRGEELSAGREKSSILADALEALIGAVYVDQGLDETRRMIVELVGGYIRNHVAQGLVRDFKTSLQERAARSWGRVPEYKITSTGPDHDKRFEAKVYLHGELSGVGQGRSKKEAEQAAAQEALNSLRMAATVADDAPAAPEQASAGQA
ncbi:MAG TPA: ribonuclease III [Actinomycetota bacterium]|nr:ribonuclease III [Actinomycetota bacterium]